MPNEIKVDVIRRRECPRIKLSQQDRTSFESGQTGSSVEQRSQNGCRHSVYLPLRSKLPSRVASVLIGVMFVSTAFERK